MSEFKSFFKSKAMNEAVVTKAEITHEPKVREEKPIETQQTKRVRGRPRNGFDKSAYQREYMRRKRAGTGSDCAVNVQQCAGPVPSSNDNVHQSLST